MFAFVFDSVSGGEWLVLLAVILIIVGPKNLPSAARKVGEIMSKLRRAADEFKRQLMTMDEEMKRAADDIKKEYIDIPDDSSEHDGASGDPYGCNPDDPDYGGDYPDGYPEEDYYGMDDSGAVMDDSGDVAEAPVSPDQASAPAQDSVSGGEASASASGTPENTNG